MADNNNLKSAADQLDAASGTLSQIKAKTSARAGEYGASSIIGKAKDNLFEFPVFISSTITIEDATAINTLLEQMYASFLQMAVSMNPVVSEDDVRRGRMFSKYKTDNTKYLEYDLPFYSAESCHNEIVTEEATFNFDRIELPAADMAAIMEAYNYEPLSEFRHYFQEDAVDRAKAWVDDKKKKIEGEKQPNIEQQVAGKMMNAANTDIANAEKAVAGFQFALNTAYSDLATAKSAFEAAKEDYNISQIDKQTYEQARDAYDRAEKAVRDAKSDLDNAERKLQDAKKSKLETSKTADQFANKNKRDREKHVFDTKVKAPGFIDESKLQKLNTMKPLMMSVSVKVMNKDGEISNAVEYVVGVKTHCRLVDANILPEVAAYPEKKMNQLSRYARWRAGEIRFIDYLFSRPEKKQAAYDSKDPSRRWYHRLYTLAHSKGSQFVAKRTTGKRAEEGLIPNATIVISKADVDNIKYQTNIDLLKASTARNFCKELFLMAFIVVDVDTRSYKILLPDVNNDFDVQSIETISRQATAIGSSTALKHEVDKLMRGR